MKKEVFIEEENACFFWKNTQILRELLHQRWRLGKGGRLSLLLCKNGVHVMVISDEGECDTHTTKETLYATETILRERSKESAP